MRYLKAITLVVGVAGALSAFAAAPALGSEFYWQSGAETIKGTEPLAGSNEGNVTLSATLFGIKTTITCKAGQLTGSLDNFAAGGTQGHLTEAGFFYSECTTNVGCSVSTLGEPIGIAYLRGLTGLAEGSSIKYSPEAGGPLGTFVFKGESCLVPGNYELTGSAKAVASSPGHLTFSSSTGSVLSLGGAPATLTGTFRATATEAAFTAGSPSAASEFYWHDTGETIKTTEPVVGQAEGSVVFSWTVFGTKTTITCKKVATTSSIDNSAAGGTQGHSTEGTQLFKECTTNVGCTVKTAGQPAGTMHVSNLTGLAEGGSTTFTHEGGSAFVTFILGGESCLLPGNYEITGSTKGTVINALGHLTFNSTSGSALSIGGSPVTFTGTFSQTATGRQFDQK